MNIPNFLTILRLFFPIFIGIVCYLKLDINLEKLIILVLFILFSLTDYLDGFLARKLNQESVFGKIFDPISDKILTSTSLIYILTFENIILIPSLLIITREFIVSGTREYMFKKKGKAIDVTFISKIKTTLQFISISLFLAQDFLINYLNIFNIAYISLWVTSILTIYTGFRYSYMTYIFNQKRK